MYIYGIERLFKISTLTSGQINFSTSSSTEKLKEQATVLLISGLLCRMITHTARCLPKEPKQKGQSRASQRKNLRDTIPRISGRIKKKIEENY